MVGTKSLEAAMVARRYYLANRQKNEIADELGISRFRVARLLDEAREQGIVRIHVEVPASVDLELGERVAEHFGLRRVIAARSLAGDPDSVVPVIGAAGANYLATLLGPSDTVGLSWGRTLTATVEAFEARSGSDVVQLAGGIDTGRTEIGGVELVRRMAERTGGRAFPLLAPQFVQSPRIAEDLRADPSIARSTQQYSQLTVAALTVGSWIPSNSATYDTLPDGERARLLAEGAVGDFFGIPFNASGEIVDSKLQDRAIGITADELARVPEVIAISGGADKADAVAAILRSDLVSTLVTDTSCAEILLTR